MKTVSMKALVAAVLFAAPSGLEARPLDGAAELLAAPLTRWDAELVDAEALQAPAVTEDLLADIAGSSSGWVAGHNARFENATVADAKALLGTLQDSSKKTWLPAREFSEAELAAVPSEFDWRTDPRAASCPSVTEIRDQANCGSCWAFGSVEAMTDRRCIASKGADKTHLSAQDVTSCDKLGDMGCSGGVPSTVYSYYKLFGVVSGGNYGDKEGCYAYQLAPCAHHTNASKYPACPAEVSAPSCAHKCVSNSALTWKSEKRHGQAGYSVCQQTDEANDCATKMAAEIYNNGPITAMYFVHQDFLAYKSGVYSHKLLSPMLGGHAIKILGFGTEAGTPYWLVANSWNEDWGDKGYFKIKRGTNECQIENSVLNGGPVAGMPALKTEEVISVV